VRGLIVDPIVVGIVEEPLVPAMLADPVAAPGHGAQVHFWGTVRDVHEGRRVVGVTYDAFRPLAEATLRAIAEEALERFGPDLGVAVYHRVGRLAVGQASVAIGVGSPHRDAAYQGCRYVIEQIKVRLPVWKCEHYADGQDAWLPGHSLR
jgi:molybdopterin synthase catalytic subunit